MSPMLEDMGEGVYIYGKMKEYISNEKIICSGEMLL